MTREHQFIPELIVRGGPAALEFYKDAFGAAEVERMMTRDGTRLVHGELHLDGHKFFVCDEFPVSEGGTCKSPETLGGARVSLPVQDMFWGGRYGKMVRKATPGPMTALRN